MSSQLIAALELAKRAALRDLVSKFDPNLARWANFRATTVDPFAAALMLEPVLEAINDKWMHTPGGGGARISLASCAIYLIDRSIDVAPAEIVSDLLRFAVEHTVVTREIRAVEGLKVQHAIELDEGLSIVPGEQLVTAGPGALIFSNGNVPSHGYGAPPHAAIVRSETFTVEIMAPPTDAMPPMTTLRNHESLFAAAMSAIVLASTGAPHFRQSFTIVDSPGWPWMAAPGFGGSEPFPVLVPYLAAVDPQRLIAAFKALRKFGNELDLAIGKLESSRRRLRLDERMVDLGTALEIVLMHGAEGSGEIINKVATRAAWLIGESGEDRLATFKTARDLYSERSKAVHTGKLKTTKAPAFPGDDSAYAKYDKLVADVIFAIAKRKSWPDWTRLVLDADGVT
ncbi:hypothetical protein CG471_12890 [Sphingobium sp. IP1]|uniref:HEPN domain-containing protein n=1 Tax=Sphingobium sp. IP1 TaxID=2021637 RepID=UPI000C069A38|nr:HEPN domain-containing protein [Sphingobium sp. IP1]PHP19322.1 hypothetical protein CG471_12890 [Sphingobium sp. IP1]